jgi:phosphoglycerate dehydrogenase-like enzyme
MSIELERKLEAGESLTGHELNLLTADQLDRYLSSEVHEEEHQKQMAELDAFLAQADMFGEQVASTLA